jgi:hypothetical protein
LPDSDPHFKLVDPDPDFTYPGETFSKF